MLESIAQRESVNYQPRSGNVLSKAYDKMKNAYDYAAPYLQNIYGTITFSANVTDDVIVSNV